MEASDQLGAATFAPQLAGLLSSSNGKSKGESDGRPTFAAVDGDLEGETAWRNGRFLGCPKLDSKFLCRWLSSIVVWEHDELDFRTEKSKCE